MSPARQEQGRHRVRHAKAQRRVSKTLTALTVQNLTLSLLPRVDKRIEDLQYENYFIPKLEHGHRVLTVLESTTDRGTGANAHKFTEADYVDGRAEKTFEVPEISLRTIDDPKQIKNLVKLNTLLEQTLNGKTVTTAKLRAVLTPEQYKDYVCRFENPFDESEINFGDGMPDELRGYKQKLKAADFQQAKYDRMSRLQRAGRAKYKQEAISKALRKAGSLYEDALARLEEIWSNATPLELYTLQNWMDRNIDFEAEHDMEIGTNPDTIPRVRGSKSFNALDSALPKLSMRLKRKECQLIALRDAAWKLAIKEQDETPSQFTEDIGQKLRARSERLQKLLRLGMDDEY